MTDEKTLYIWDLAGTLFQEIWNIEKTGFPDYEAWMENKIGKKIEELSDREYEAGYDDLYRAGWYVNLDINPGFCEVLSRTKNNEAFTSGPPNQIDCRAEYLNPRTGFDVRKFFQRINSTFDYKEINKKTEEIMLELLENRYNEGYRVFVYSEDKIKYCETFLAAAKGLREKHNDVSFRLYHVLNDKNGIKDKGEYFEAGGLLDILENEKKLYSDK